MPEEPVAEDDNTTVAVPYRPATDLIKAFQHGTPVLVSQDAFTIADTAGHRHVITADDVIQHSNGLQDNDARWAFQQAVMSNCTAYLELQSDAIGKIITNFEQSGTFERAGVTYSDWLKLAAPLLKIRERAERNARDKLTTNEKVRSSWPALYPYVMHDGQPQEQRRKLRSLAIAASKAVDPEMLAVASLNRAFINRLSNPRPGVPAGAYFTSLDISNAVKMAEYAIQSRTGIEEVTADELELFHLTSGNMGLLTKIGSTMTFKIPNDATTFRTIDYHQTIPQVSIESVSTTDHSDAPPQVGGARSLAAVPTYLATRSRRDVPMAKKVGEASSAQSLASSITAASTASRSGGGIAVTRSTEEPFELLLSDESESSDNRNGLSTTGKRTLRESAKRNRQPIAKKAKSTRHCGRSFETLSEESESSIEAQKNCTCVQRVSRPIRCRVSKARRNHPSMLDLVADVLETERQSKPLCHFHIKKLAGVLGLRTDRLTRKALYARVITILNNYHKLPHFMVSTDGDDDHPNYAWFRVSVRPTLPLDRLGVFRYSYDLSVKLSPQLKDIDWPSFVNSLGTHQYPINASVVTEFADSGSVVVPCFTWWFQQGKTTGILSIDSIIRAEFELYKHHARKDNRSGRSGWQTNQLFSLSQQLMRQDLVYYLLYVALRPDHCHSLISYPYHTKYADKENRTQLRQIDIDMHRAIKTGTGTNMIQGSVSLTNETDAEATVIIPKMHKHMEEWWQRIQSRQAGPKVSGLITSIDETIFTTVGPNSDASHFNTNWTPQRCGEGDVRITRSEIPYGTQATPQGSVRRTMLPWFMAIQEDGETLEIAEGGTFSQLSQSHRDMTAPPATPSGYTTYRGVLPYAFPAAPQLTGLGPISDALVGRLRWSNPTVAYELRTIFAMTDNERRTYISDWREKARQQMHTSFAQLMDAEEIFFGGKAYARGVAYDKNMSIASTDTDNNSYSDTTDYEDFRDDY